MLPLSLLCVVLQVLRTGTNFSVQYRRTSFGCCSYSCVVVIMSAAQSLSGRLMVIVVIGDRTAALERCALERSARVAKRMAHARQSYSLPLYYHS